MRSHAVQFTHVKDTIGWFLVYSQLHNCHRNQFRHISSLYKETRHCHPPPSLLALSTHQSLPCLCVFSCPGRLPQMEPYNIWVLSVRPPSHYLRFNKVSSAWSVEPGSAWAQHREPVQVLCLLCSLLENDRTRGLLRLWAELAVVPSCKCTFGELVCVAQTCRVERLPFMLFTRYV